MTNSRRAGPRGLLHRCRTRHPGRKCIEAWWVSRATARASNRRRRFSTSSSYAGNRATTTDGASMTQTNGMQMPRVAIVTGAGSGIGKAAALELLRSGWAVVLLGRRIEPLREIANDVAFEARAFAVS